MSSIAEIQKRIDALSDAMIAKGLRKPRAEIEFRSHSEPRLLLCWEPYKKRPYESDQYKFFSDGTLDEMFAKASSFIADQPDADETKFREFMTALGGVVDLGKENGIEVELLNPLVATMKKLSENAITYERVQS